MNTGKKMISLLLMLCMVVLLVPAVSGAESGTCGEKAKWNLENGVLTITGSGDMADYASADETPWASLRGQIEKVVFDGAITRIGSNAFAECPNLKHVTFSTATVTIGKRAFYNCTQLGSADYKEPSKESSEENGEEGNEENKEENNEENKEENNEKGNEENNEQNKEENGEIGDTDIPGDINGDGEVDGRDVIRLMKFLAEDIDEKTGEVVKINEKNSDLNEDGEVNELDLLRLLKALAEDGIPIQVK